MIKHSKVEEYINSFPQYVQKTLKTLRTTIKNTAPDATEDISYGMAAYKLEGKPLVYFGGFKNHIGFFPTGSGVAAFEKNLKEFKTSKGTIQFPLDKPLPLQLITKIVKFRVDENKARKVNNV